MRLAIYLCYGRCADRPVERRLRCRSNAASWIALGLLYAGFFSISAQAQQINETRRRTADMIDLIGVPLGSIDGVDQPKRAERIQVRPVKNQQPATERREAAKPTVAPTPAQMQMPSHPALRTSSANPLAAQPSPPQRSPIVVDLPKVKARPASISQSVPEVTRKAVQNPADFPTADESTRITPQRKAGNPDQPPIRPNPLPAQRDTRIESAMPDTRGKSQPRPAPDDAIQTGSAAVSAFVGNGKKYTNEPRAPLAQLPESHSENASPKLRNRQWVGEPVFAADHDMLDDDDDVGQRRFLPAQGPKAHIDELELPKAEPLRRSSSLFRRDAPDGDELMTTAAMPREQIDIHIRSLPLETVLREIGKMAGYTVNVGPGVKGTVSDKRLQGTADVVFGKLGQEFDLFWFNDGFTIHVDPTDEQKSRFLKLNGLNSRDFASRLRDAGLSQFRDRIQVSSKDRLVRVVGSDAFIKAVEASLISPAEEKQSVQIVRFGRPGN